MKKRLFALLTALALLLTIPGISALGEAEPAETDLTPFFKTEAAVEGKTVPVLIDVLGEEKPQEMEFTLYFVEGGDIPYVALPDFAPLLSELMLYGEETDDLYGLYTVNAEGGDIELPEHYFTLSRTNPFSAMVLNTVEDTIEFSDFNTFTQVPGHTALVTTLDLPEPKVQDMAAFYTETEGLTPEEQAKKWEEESAKFAAEKAEAEKDELIVLRESPLNIGGDPVMIHLKDYLIDLVENNGVCYVPLQTLTDLFMGDMYLFVVYNTEKLFIFTYGSDLIEQVNAKEPEAMSDDFALFNYNELRLNLDLHYGLKAEHGITDFGDYFQKTGLLADLTGTSGKKFDSALTALMANYLDDLHSGLVAYSWRHEPDTAAEELSGFMDLGGPGMSDNVFHSYWYNDARSNAYAGRDIPMYEEVGDTAFITFDTFNVTVSDTAEYYSPDLVLDPAEFVIPNPAHEDWTDDEAAEETTEETTEKPAEETEQEPAAPREEVDTIKLFLYAFKQINRENSPIKRVVIDLSNNGGGAVVAAIFVMNFINGNSRIVLRDTMTGAQSVSTYIADCNLDNIIGNSESMFSKDKKVYVLISPVSFSCGNLVPAACKAAHVTLVGQSSGGGACVVHPACTASGTLFQISGTKQLSVIKNGSVYNIDKGIEPDIYLSTEAAFYDRPALVEYLHSLK